MSMEEDLRELLKHCQEIYDFRNEDVNSGVCHLPIAGGLTDPPETTVRLHSGTIAYQIYQQLLTLVSQGGELKLQDWLERQRSPRTGEDVVLLIYDLLDRLLGKSVEGTGPIQPDQNQTTSPEGSQTNESTPLTGTFTTEGDDALSSKQSKGSTETGPKPERRGRGRKKADYETVQREADLAVEWVRARDSGVCKSNFAKDKGTTLEEFDKLLDRVAARKRASE